MQNDGIACRTLERHRRRGLENQSIACFLSGLRQFTRLSRSLFCSPPIGRLPRIVPRYPLIGRITPRRCQSPLPISFLPLRSILPSSHRFPTPKGLRPKAQGWLRFLQPTLGVLTILHSTPKGLRHAIRLRNPFGVDHTSSPTQGWPHKTRPTLGSGPLPPSGQSFDSQNKR